MWHPFKLKNKKQAVIIESGKKPYIFRKNRNINIFNNTISPDLIPPPYTQRHLSHPSSNLNTPKIHTSEKCFSNVLAENRKSAKTHWVSAPYALFAVPRAVTEDMK